MLLLTGIGLACLPKILFGLLIIAVFLFILYVIINKVVPTEYRSTANWITVVVVLIIILWALIQLYQYGAGWLC